MHDERNPDAGVAALPPDITGPPLLSDPCFVLAPDFKPLGFRNTHGAAVVARLTVPPVCPQLRKCRVRPGSYGLVPQADAGARVSRRNDR